jgi:hypothetical protein
VDSQETKIRRGQAYNLAVHDAVASGNATSPKYIYQRYVYYHNLADIIQGNDIETILEAINNPELDKVCKQLQEVMK